MSIQTDHAKGIYYADRDVWKPEKFAVWSPTGVLLSLWDTYREAHAEAQRLKALNDPQQELFP